jgi:hypothetical protein
LQAHQGFFTYPGSLADGNASLGPVMRSTLASTSTGVTITDVRANMTVTYAYSLDGDDINLEAVLKNNDALPFSNLMIGLPAFVFSPKVSGNLKSWDSSYLAVNKDKALHPSTWVPLAVAYARDENYGLALHCKSHFDKPSLFDAAMPSGKNGVPPTVAAITLYLQDSVSPGNQLVVDVTIHLTTATDLPSLLSSYIRDFHAFAPPMQYQPDDRPWMQFAAIDPSYVTAKNPLGYNGDNRRLDLPGGIQRFEDLIWPSVGVTQGTIFWQPQGCSPRGGMYRPDFDVWPESVAANLPTLIAWYKANNLRFGLCARPSTIITPGTATDDEGCELDGNNASQMAMLLKRFDHVTKLGVDAFYLDSFGDDINSYHIMKQIRAHLGSAIPTYSEFTSDLMLAYSGVYSELNPTDGAGGPPDGSTEWYSLETLGIYRLLFPRSGILTTRFADMSGHSRATVQQFAQWKLTPMVEDYQARQFTSFFQELITNHMNGNLWK